jgi:hypothetical protein
LICRHICGNTCAAAVRKTLRVLLVAAAQAFLPKEGKPPFTAATLIPPRLFESGRHAMHVGGGIAVAA